MVNIIIYIMRGFNVTIKVNSTTKAEMTYDTYNIVYTYRLNYLEKLET